MIHDRMATEEHVVTTYIARCSCGWKHECDDRTHAEGAFDDHLQYEREAH